jgi:DNA ligase-associated metallophosphoesterase
MLMMPFSPKQLLPSNVRRPGLSRTHTIRLAGAGFVPHLSGGLYWPEEQTLVVSDLHLEHGVSLARRGLHVPPFDTRSTLQELRLLLAETAARRLILLGDSFHAPDAHAVLDEESCGALKELTSAVETIWICGNHDPDPPDGLGGHAVTELTLGPVVLRHIPSPVPHGCVEISGHLHPGASVINRGRRTHGKCFVTDQRRLIMPAFGAYTGALSVASRAYDGLFDEPEAQVFVLGRSAIHRLPLSRVR